MEIKIGDRVNALFFPSVEVNGIVVNIDRHMICVELEDKLKRWTPRILCRKVENQVDQKS